MREWKGEYDDVTWNLEVEPDCFAEGEPHVVTLWVKQEEAHDRGYNETLVIVAPEQAREIAAALTASAEGADRNNARKAVLPREGQGDSR